MSEILWPVYEFRPLSTSFRPSVGVRRYAEGGWLPDDGEYDLAFIADGVCLMFEPPYQRNIICSWLKTHWSGSVKDHPRGNPWHYALRHGTTEWGGDWGRDHHPNRLAGCAGMNKMCSERGASSGQHVEMRADDPIIAAGLLRERDTKKVFSWPDNLTCCYCGASPKFPARCEAA